LVEGTHLSFTLKEGVMTLWSEYCRRRATAQYNHTQTRNYLLKRRLGML
jgi:hypothetical protein